MECSEKVTSLTTTFLDQPPSCLEFCPTAPDHFVIGTYLLSEGTTPASTSADSTRTGTLQLFRLDPESFNITQVQRLALDHAVFDLHFSPRDPSTFAVALSTAAISLCRIESSSEGEGASDVTIKFVNTIPVHDDPSQLTLYLAWIPPYSTQNDNQASNPDGFAVSFSGGQISVFCTNTPSHELAYNSLSETQFPGSPPVEVWYLAFSSANTPRSQELSLFSGDDFGQIREFAFPAPLSDSGDENDDAVPAYQKSNDRGKHHGAGVTAILPLSVDELGTVLLTGSYDDHIRVYRANMRGQVLAEMHLGGGVWRLKLMHTTTRNPMTSDSAHVEQRNYYILASCMHAGTRIVELSHSSSGTDGGELWSFRVMAEFTEHNSMNYASDFWTRRNGQPGNLETLCVSSSFYDKRVCVWSPPTAISSSTS